MRPLSHLWRNLIHKKRVDGDLDAEIRSFVKLLAEEKIKTGVEPAAAHRQAILECGGIEQVKEEVRAVKAGRLLEIVAADGRHAWRMILKMPFTAAVVIASLGVGIGVNTVVFTWIQAVMFHPMPGVPGGSSFEHLETRGENGSYPGMSWLEFNDMRPRLTSFRDLLAFRSVPLYIGEVGSSERVYGSLVSGNYFSTLGIAPALGRFIQPAEAAHPGAEPLVVISHEFWQTHFHGSPDALGQTVRVNDLPLTVIGVTPPRFQGTLLGLNFSMWVPATLAPVLFPGSRELTDRSVRGYLLLGKLAPGVSRPQAETQLSGALRQLAEIYPETNARMRGEVFPFWSPPRGPQRLLANSLLILQAILFLLLLAVCGNTANLMLARASTRHREIGVRLAIGAPPWRIRSLLLIENCVLAFCGAGLGVVLAAWGTQALRAVPMTGAFPIRFQTGIDWLSLAFASLLAMLCGLTFGLFPAAQLSRIDPQSAIRSGIGKAAPNSLRNTLMGVEVALALMVLIVAGLFFRGFRETRAAHPGFERDGILLAAYDLTTRQVDAASARDFAGKLLARLRALPSVQAAAIASSVPLDIHGMPLQSFRVEGYVSSQAGPDQCLRNIVTPGYLSTMGIALHSGEDFANLRDLTHPPQVIVNREFVRRYLPNLPPLGRKLNARGKTFIICGVAGNSRYESFSERPTPLIYFSYRDNPSPLGEVHLRIRPGAEMLLSADVQRVIRDIDPSCHVYDVRTLNEHIEKNAMLRRIPAQMFVVLGPLLLALAAIGIYAIVAYSVAQRTTEIGVRLALGATPGRVVRHIVRETLGVIYKGALWGWLLAAIVAFHLLHGTLYWPVFLGVPATLLLVTTYACWLPAHRASRVDPLLALRHE